MENRNELIDNYIQGTLSTDDLALFNQLNTTDSNFVNELENTLAIAKGASRLALKTSISKAKRHYQLKQALKRAALVLITLAVGAATYLHFSNQEQEGASSPPASAKIEKTSAPTQSAPLQVKSTSDSLPSIENTAKKSDETIPQIHISKDDEIIEEVEQDDEIILNTAPIEIEQKEIEPAQDNLLYLDDIKEAIAPVSVISLNNAEQRQSFTLPKGTKITTPTDGLMTKNGKAVKGTVDYHVREFYSKESFVRFRSTFCSV